MRNLLFYLAIILTTVQACTEEYQFDFDNSTEHIVIEGVISDKPIYLDKCGNYPELNSYVRITKTINNFDSTETCINNALVIISDNNGKIDTFPPAPESLTINIIISDSIVNVPTFTIRSPYYTDGYYYSREFTGVPGNTYNVTIKYEGKEYHSSAYMPKLPTVDSLTFKYIETYKDAYYIPYIYFRKLANKNSFYLFKSNYNTGGWGVDILNDEHLQPYVNGIDVFKGQSNSFWSNNYTSSRYFIRMQSITEEVYNYYDQLIRQFHNDGGTFKPTPATPISNIDNGAMGFFRASSEHFLFGTLPYTK